MPWREQTPMSERSEFLQEAQKSGANISALSKRYGISRNTAHKWLRRWAEEKTLEEHSRRPKNSPEKTPQAMEQQILEVRQAHPDWGGRKIRRVLADRGIEGMPAISTITAILRRNGYVDPEESHKHTAWQRFERNRPNELWQMDFKGYFATAEGGYCHPLVVLDDHSRFLIGLKACPNETAATVKEKLTAMFERFGLPEEMLMDNGSAWGFSQQARHTILTAWLIRLGITIVHGRPFHPQTQGKTERFNRTLLTEVIRRFSLADLTECQSVFNDWWHVYNFERPHEALQLDVPANHYAASTHPFPAILPPVTYAPEDTIRKVDISGKIFYLGKRFHISSAFRHQPVAIRPALQDGVFHVYFCQQKVAQINLREDNNC